MSYDPHLKPSTLHAVERLLKAKYITTIISRDLHRSPTRRNDGILAARYSDRVGDVTTRIDATRAMRIMTVLRSICEPAFGRLAQRTICLLRAL